MRASTRRLLPLILVAAFVAWIILITVLITISPVAGTGNPVD